MERESVLRPIIGIMTLFVLVIGTAVFLAPGYMDAGLQAFGDEGANNPGWSVFYLVMILAFTGVVIFLIRKGFKKLIQGFILLMIFVTIAQVIFTLSMVAVTDDGEWTEVEPDVDFAPDAIWVKGADDGAIIYLANTTEGLASASTWGNDLDQWDDQPVGSNDSSPPVTEYRLDMDGVNGTLQVTDTADDTVVFEKGFDGDILAAGTGDIFEDFDGRELMVVLDRETLLYYTVDDPWDSSIVLGMDTDTDETGGQLVLIPQDGDDFTMVILDGDRLLIQEVVFIPASWTNMMCGFALAIALILAVLLVKYPEWYIVNSVGVLMALGITTILGISLAILPILVLLILLAVYDAWAVYRTKHMVELADSVVGMRLPLLLVMPKDRGYSFREQKGLQEQLDSGEKREAIFVGLGDIIIPGTLAVSAFAFLSPYTAFGGLEGNLVVAMGTLVGILGGYLTLMRFVIRGNPQAGLPLLNGGAITGYVISYILVYQDLSLGISWPW